jgi:hypothetical protein
VFLLKFHLFFPLRDHSDYADLELKGDIELLQEFQRDTIEDKKIIMGKILSSAPDNTSRQPVLSGSKVALFMNYIAQN